MSQRLLASFLIIPLLLAGTGCSVNTTEGSTSGGTSAAPGETSGSLDGSYSGAYQGDAKGPVRVTVRGEDIDVVVTVGGKDYAASGALTGGGGVSVGIGTGDGVIVTFEGTFTSRGGSGTWRSSIATKGTWSVAR